MALPAQVVRSLGISPSLGRGLALVWTAVVSLVIAVAILRSGLLPAVLGGAALLVLVVSFRWPTLPLYAFAFLIPVEELLVFGTFGTLSRYAGIVFIVAFGLPRLGRLRLSTMPSAAWVFVGWACLSLVWAIDASATVSELATLLPLFLVSVMVAILIADRPSVVRPLMWTYSASASLTAIAGLWIYASGGGSGGDRVAALPGQDPAHYAALLLPALAFSLFELVNHRETILSGLVAALSFTGVVVSGTRGAWLAAIVVILVFIVPRLSRLQQAFGFALVSVFLLLSLQLPAIASLAARAENAVSSGGAGRTDIWTVGATIFSEAPIVGIGYANFTAAYTPEAVRASDVGEYAATNQALVDLGLKQSASRNAHSIIVGTLAELGIIGFVLMAWFVVPLIWRGGWGPDADGIRAALVALLISALFLDVLNRKQVWLIIGIACGLGYLARRGRGMTQQRAFPTSTPTDLG